MGTGPGFTSPAAALAAVRDGLHYLSSVDAAGLPAVAQADCLRGLARAEAAHTAAQARMLAAFSAGGGYEDDGQGSAQVWLRWQTRITRGAAAAATGWVKRLTAHPAAGQALASGSLSPSWAREICHWSDQLPAGLRADADDILLAAAAGGADLADQAALAEEMRRRAGRPDEDGDDGFDDRNVWLDVTFGGAGRLAGGLTPACAAALSAVLDALGKKAGPEDVRSAAQRRHDALEEACRRLIGSRCLPERAGQPTQIQLHLTLDQLRGMPGAAEAEAEWAAGTAGGPGGPGTAGAEAARAAAGGQPGWLSGPAAAAYACDAALTPIVTGHLDSAALAELEAAFLARSAPGRAAASTGPGHPAMTLRPATRARLHDTLLRYAADALSGPAGLAAFLRTRLLGSEFPSVSLPLDTGTATDQVPPHLRRAVIARDRHCAFPGCHQPPAACHVHHLRPRAAGGPTTLANCLLLCGFHHLIAVHRWGWSLALGADGTVTATSPDGTRTLHSHSPPTAAA
ncbi:MAG: DUF222 domain-containing protein [Streptosporangiales bacterium]